MTRTLSILAMTFAAMVLSACATAGHSARNPSSAAPEIQRRMVNEEFASDPKSWMSTKNEELVAYCGGKYGEVKITKYVKEANGQKHYIVSITSPNRRKTGSVHAVVYRGSVRAGDYPGLVLTGARANSSNWFVVQHLSSYSHGGVSDKATIYGFDWDDSGSLAGVTVAGDSGVESMYSCQTEPNRPGNWEKETN